MECYLIGDDSVVEVKRDDWSAQLFTPVKDHRGWYLQYKVYATPSDRRVRLEIQETTGGEPNGNVLAYSQPLLNRLSPYSPGKIFNDTVAFGCDLKEGVLYALVMRSLNMRWVDKVYWRYDAGDATYPRGYRLFSGDEGVTWTHYPNDSLMFAVWGDPPAPPPPPPPPKDNFAILDVQQEDTGTGIKFVVATDVPCHLYMLWTDLEPEKHATPIIRRGVKWKDAIRFCFVNWNENQQEEEGYTIYHTFTKEPWEYCETRWFTFRAKIEDEWAPSVGPIFKKHRVVPAFFIKKFYPHILPLTDSCDGRVRRGYIGDLTWADVRNGDGTWAQSSANTSYVDIAASRTAYRWNNLNRMAILFNTDVIPAGSTILEAKLHLYFMGHLNTLSPAATINVFESWPLTTGEILPADYQHFGTTHLSTARIINDIPLLEWTAFTLNADGRALIIPEGCTKLAMREATFDAPNHEPPWGSLNRAFIQWESAHVENLRPCLEVKYSPP